MFINEKIEDTLRALKEEYEAKVAKVKESQSLAVEREKAVKELASAKEALKVAQKKFEDLDSALNRALGKTTAKKAPKAPSESSPRGKRGAKAEKIIAVLSSVFPEGMSVANLEAKTGESNLGVWFATTGKKTKGIVKLARGSYAYNPAIDGEAPGTKTPIEDLNLTGEPLAKADPSKSGK